MKAIGKKYRYLIRDRSKWNPDVLKDRKTFMKFELQAIWHFEFSVNGKVVRYLDSRLPYKGTRRQNKKAFDSLRKAFDTVPPIPHIGALSDYMIRTGRWKMESLDESLLTVTHTRDDLPFFKKLLGRG